MDTFNFCKYYTIKLLVVILTVSLECFNALLFKSNDMYYICHYTTAIKSCTQYGSLDNVNSDFVRDTQITQRNDVGSRIL